MTNNNLFSLAGWSALIAAFITLFTIITFAIGMTVGWENVGLPNDIVAILMYSLHVPILVGLDRLLDRPHHAQLAFGILAALVVTVVQILFVGGALESESTVVPAALSTIIISLVYLAYNWQARRTQALPNGLTLIGLIANAGGALASAARFIAADHPLVWIGGLLYLLNVIWLFWTGRVWLKSN